MLQNRLAAKRLRLKRAEGEEERTLSGRKGSQSHHLFPL